MKPQNLLYILMLVLIGCGNPSEVKKKTVSERASFSSSGNMILGNILVAELGKNIYKKDEPEAASSTKAEESLKSKIENDFPEISTDENSAPNYSLRVILNIN